MKKIFVNYLGRTGGATLYSYEMTKGLIENGAEVYAVLSAQNEMLEEWKKLKFQKVLIVPTYTDKMSFISGTLKFLFFYRQKIKNFFRDTHFDAVYCPMFHPWFRWINRMILGDRLFITLHDPVPHSGSFFKYTLLNWQMKKDLQQASDVIILSSQYDEFVQKNYNKNKEQVHIIPHGVFDFYNNFPLREDVVTYSKSVNFLFFGRIEGYKGLRVLAAAYKKLANRYKDISLTIAGNGDFSIYQTDYEELPNTTIYNRWIKDEEVRSFFHGARLVLVLPYLDATQSGVVNIAMENKVLVIGTRTGGLQEQIVHGDTGLLAEPGNADSLADMMKIAIEQPDYVQKVLANAERYNQKLSWKSLSRNIIDAI